ncbi:NUDIX domain-containing protein [Candidatus Rariloculus sp.]|uniref:NUDIX domain-containing protein n=1 Tax=Candidatus Rariloculus sp. TaxID=3101265 RepID=UPI003D0B715C
MIARRRGDAHMGGSWEFPGGKRALAESVWDALCRELSEELGISVQHAEPLLDYVHEYPDRCVRLDVWLVHRYGGEPQRCEGQALRWVTIEELDSSGLLSADQPIIDALRSRAARSAQRK